VLAVYTNRPPVVLANSSYTVQQGGTLSVEAPGPLGNVTDPDVGDALHMDVDSQPGSGTLVSHPDGSFAYTPTAGFIGLVSFTFAAKDFKGGSALGTVTVNVTGALRVVADCACALRATQ
jgi:hypothetical protein